MWKKIASLILRNRLSIIISMLLFMVACLFSIVTFGLQFSTTNAQLLPSSDPVMQDFNHFQKTFGNEANMIVIGYEDPKMSNKENLQKWNTLLDEIKKIPDIEGIFSMTDAKKLVRDTVNGGFKMENIISDSQKSDWNLMRNEIRNFPFYESLLFNENNEAMQAVVYMNPDILNSKKRISDVVLINDLVNQFTEDTGINLYLSGMPVIRTMNSEQVKSETVTFILASLFTTCLIFFLFFRSFRATFVAISVVMSAVILCFAMMSVFNFEITMLTALVPPLLIVIGIPNCIYLINKYQSEYKKHNNKIKALHRMIVHVGNPAMLTNLTTAFGFFTFIFTESSTLKEFGIIASLNIIGIFFISFLLIPTLYNYFPEPKERHLNHHNPNWTNSILKWIENIAVNHRKWVYFSTLLLFMVSVVGIMQITRNGNMLDDMSKKAKFYKDISFFDEQFGGVLPLEIVIDTKRPNGVSSLSTLRKMDEISFFIDSLNHSSKALGINELVKFAKQGYYGNSPEFYQLPSNQERAFILNEIKNSKGDANMIKNYIDSTASVARMTTLLQNLESKKMESVISNIQTKLSEIFPKEQYKTYTTGMAYIFMKGTSYLTKNLLISLSLAVFLIAIFMAIMFRSPLMILIALIPNFLPLLTTAGAMGYLGIPIKPSTILVFSIAFGIAVDDTIHFLAKYRQDLKLLNGNIKEAVILSIDEVGNSMFYTSVVLFTGFSVFMFSGFIGIVALGGLVSFTLLVAMLSNLILLPSLLMSYGNLSDKNFSNPDIDYFEEEEE